MFNFIFKKNYIIPGVRKIYIIYIQGNAHDDARDFSKLTVAQAYVLQDEINRHQQESCRRYDHASSIIRQKVFFLFLFFFVLKKNFHGTLRRKNYIIGKIYIKGVWSSLFQQQGRFVFVFALQKNNFVLCCKFFFYRFCSVMNRIFLSIS